MLGLSPRNNPSRHAAAHAIVASTGKSKTMRVTSWVYFWVGSLQKGTCFRRSKQKYESNAGWIRTFHSLGGGSRSLEARSQSSHRLGSGFTSLNQLWFAAIEISTGYQVSDSHNRYQVAQAAVPQRGVASDSHALYSKIYFAA